MTFLNANNAGSKSIELFVLEQCNDNFYINLKSEIGETIVGEHQTSSASTNKHLNMMEDVDPIALAELVTNTYLKSIDRYVVEFTYHFTFLKDVTSTFREEDYHSTIDIYLSAFVHRILTSHQIQY
ncbi:unnamed protein product [Rotaria sordida]|uniref:Uncharacterized protein n=1 Tax=Rotaria sordida TaxID=392033 RepID=A0A819PA99_9BILA|nr:unnamed protein product [Rotaria sordida]